MFLPIIIGLAVFLLLFAFFSLKSAASDKKAEGELRGMLEELSAQIKEKNEALKEGIEKRRGMEEELGALKTKLEAQNKKIGAKAAEDTETKKASEKVVADLALKDKQLKEALDISARQANEIRELGGVIKKKEAEFVSLNEAYNGLKEQYDDLGRQLAEIHQKSDSGGASLTANIEPKAVAKINASEDKGKSADAEKGV